MSDASGHIGRQTAQAYNKSSQRCRNQRKLPQTSRAKSFQGNLNKSCQCSENSITDFLRPAFLFPRREKYGMMGLTAVKETGKSEFIVLPLEKPCNIRRFRLSNPQTVCTFPCFFPYGLKQGKDFYSPLTTLSSSRAELRFASLVEWA